MLYHVDSLHPSVLVCSGCGAAVTRLPEDAGPPEPAELGELTVEQVAHAWPGLAADVAWHDLLCGREEVGAVYARVLADPERWR